MINTLLSFVKAECLGLRHAHLCAFEDMLALLAAHDHTNYMRWGTVYLESMKKPPHSSLTVYEEFVNEGFGVKTTNQAFVRIATDKAIENVNKMCKIAGGIVNITRNESARQR